VTVFAASVEAPVDAAEIRAVIQSDAEIRRA